MPAWPGGSCPDCGDSMPPNLIHCQSCRALLNTDLETSSIAVPQFIPLQEIDHSVDQEGSSGAMLSAQPKGYFISCPKCQEELKVSQRFLGEHVACKHCQSPFEIAQNQMEQNLIGIYTDCPHCTERIRAAKQYLGTQVACNFCAGHIELLQ